MKNVFRDYHPAVNVLWAALVLAGAMGLHHPVSLAISLGCAVLWSVRLGGRKSARFAVRGMLPLLVITALLNPLFSHEGVTILWYFPNGNPLTMESICYGISAGVVLVSVILWFSGLTKVLTADKIMALFGKAVPSLSLLLSMAMGMVPRFRRRLAVVRDNQKAIGRDPAEGTMVQRAKKGLQMLSILVTWSMEDAIQTADSMKSRGYGLPDRTACDPCPMTERDKNALLVLGILGALLIGFWITGELQWQYYPVLWGAEWNLRSVTAQVVYLAVCSFPMALDGWTNRLWNRKREGETL